MRRTAIIDVLALLALGSLTVALWRLAWMGAFTDSNPEMTAEAAKTVASLSGRAVYALLVGMAMVLLLWVAARWLIWSERRAKCALSDDSRSAPPPTPLASAP